MDFSQENLDLTSPNQNQSLDSLFEPLDFTSPCSLEAIDSEITDLTWKDSAFANGEISGIDSIFDDVPVELEFQPPSALLATSSFLPNSYDFLENHTAFDAVTEEGASTNISEFELEGFWNINGTLETKKEQHHIFFNSSLKTSKMVEKLVKETTVQKQSFRKPKLPQTKNIFKISKYPVNKIKSLIVPPIRPFIAKKTKQKRAKPEFTEKYFHRAEMYWEKILDNCAYTDQEAKLTKTLQNLGLVKIPENEFKKKVVAALLPNYIDVESFEELQGVDGWYYKQNPVRNDTEMLALRWCNQKQNFYTPYVYRHRITGNGLETEKQFLCPYCPFDKTMDMSIIFHTAATAAYQHHVCKDHGVYTTGYEMPIPVVGKINNEHVALCGECHQAQKIVLETNKNDLRNCLIAYFRHCFSHHNLKRQNRSNDTKTKDLLNQRAGRDGYIYEDIDEVLKTFL